MMFASYKLCDIHQQLLKDIDSGNFALLDLTHHLSAGYKACYTKIAYEGMDQMRQACGGAGFNSFSGFTLIITDYAPNTTFEGDNTVMLQQAAKLIIKNAKMVKNGKKTSGIFEYLNHTADLLKEKASINSVNDITCLKQLEKALTIRAAYKVKTATDKYFNSPESENEKVNALYGIDIVSMAHAHIMLVTFKYFLQTIEGDSIKCPKNKENLLNLARVYVMHELQQDSQPLYETGYFQVGTAPLLLQGMKHVIDLIRPQLIPLVEAWQISDSVIVSSIGNEYGDIYE